MSVARPVTVGRRSTPAVRLVVRDHESTSSFSPVFKIYAEMVDTWPMNRLLGHRRIGAIVSIVVLASGAGIVVGGPEAASINTSAQASKPAERLGTPRSLPPTTVGPTTTAPHHPGGVHIDNSLIPAPTTESYSTERLRPTTEQPTDGDTGSFRIPCGYSHMSYDDPIVYPGQPGRAHLHTFFGNTAADANSTYESLVSTGNSTCRGGTINRSAYWMPSMIDATAGRPIAPTSALWYYKSGQAQIFTEMRGMPAGLRMIAGDMRQTGPVERPIYHFSCYTSDLQQQYSFQYTIPACPAGDYLAVNILFPQCWNGRDLDSPDHQSHMAYPWNSGWACPPTHPIAIPEISLNIYWKVQPSDGSSASWRLASDNYSSASPGGYSMHADWFDGWKPEARDAWVNGCVIAHKDCHAHLLGNGQEFY
jgi:Domain of unknown function (DUF1996)